MNFISGVEYDDGYNDKNDNDTKKTYKENKDEE